MNRNLQINDSSSIYGSFQATETSTEEKENTNTGITLSKSQPSKLRSTSQLAVVTSSSSLASSSSIGSSCERVNSSRNDDVGGMMTSSTTTDHDRNSPNSKPASLQHRLSANYQDLRFPNEGFEKRKSPVVLKNNDLLWRSSDDDDVIKNSSGRHPVHKRLRSPYKLGNKKLPDNGVRRWTSHSSTYPSSSPTNSIATSSTSDLSDKNKEPESDKLLGINLKSKPEIRMPRSPAATPKNIETYRRTFNSWHDREDNENCGDSGSNFPPIIPQRHLLIVNVSGKKFEIDLRRLNEHPETLLGDSKRREMYWDPYEKEIFFDRHQKSFEAVHNYYMGLSQGGKLIRPDEVPLDIFLNEVRFYRFGREAISEFLKLEGIFLEKKVKLMPDTEIKRIIWRIFEDHDSSWEARIITLLSAAIITISVVVFCMETLDAFKSLDDKFAEILQPAMNTCLVHLNKTKFPAFLLANKSYTEHNFVTDSIEKLKLCGDDTHLSNEDRYLTTRCSIHLGDESVDYVVEMLSNNTKKEKKNGKKPHHLRHQDKNTTNLKPAFWYTYQQNLDDIKDICLNLSETKTKRSRYYWYILESHMHLPAGIIFIIETSCIVWFLIEIGLRFYCSPKRKRFFMNFLNIIDVLAILPYFITFIITTIAVESSLKPQTATILRTIRLVRMLRILKLSRYSRGFRILGLTLVRSTRVLFLLVCFQVVLAIFFSSIGYFVEHDEKPTKFTSIPESFWWALITMTTVGYGDICPTTLWGKITGACCAIMGILSISFPVPVIVSNFNYLYNQDKDDCKLEPEDLMNQDYDDVSSHSEIFSRFDRFSNLKVRRRDTVKSTEEKVEKTPMLLWDLVKDHYTSNKRGSDQQSCGSSLDPGSQASKLTTEGASSEPKASNRSDDVIEKRKSKFDVIKEQICAENDKSLNYEGKTNQNGSEEKSTLLINNKRNFVL